MTYVYGTDEDSGKEYLIITPEEHNPENISTIRLKDPKQAKHCGVTIYGLGIIRPSGSGPVGISYVEDLGDGNSERKNFLVKDRETAIKELLKHII